MSRINELVSLKEIISYMPGNVYWTDINGVYQGCNTNVVKVLKKKSIDDVIGKKIHELLEDQHIADEVEKIDSAVMRSDREVVAEQEAFDAEGKWAVYFTRKQPLHDAQGHVIGVLGMSLDITERKLAEQEAIKAREEAEAASRAKTEFLASMSHDVKTPLSGIIALSEMLSFQLTANEKQKAEDIHRAGKVLMVFFENCIELSKMDMTDLKDIRKPFSLTKVIESIHTLFTPSAIAKQLLFVTHQDVKLPAVLVGNPINIYRIILNLIGNAIKFTQSGSVTLSVVLDQPVDDENIIVKIIVQDTGPGIPKDKHKIIFEKLQRLTPSYYNKQEGHGIGLYIVDQYVKAMDGTIEVDSAIGEGSKFTVTIPLKIASPDETDITMPPQLTENEVPSARVPEPVKRSFSASENKNVKEGAATILLVEDNPMIHGVAREMLQATGVNVDVAETGQEAIALFKSKKYSLIFMDIGLPDMDGYEVSQRLRAYEAEIKVAKTPILALTAHATVDIKRFCMGAGMQGVLNKPLSRKQAQQIFDRYVLNNTSITVDGLAFLEALQATTKYVPSQLPVIDFSGCVAIVETEARAREMLSMIVESLDSTFIPEISHAYQRNDDSELQKALHKFLGGLCYVSTPALKQALSDFQTAVKEKLATREQAYQALLQEIKQLKLAYSTLQKAGMA